MIVLAVDTAAHLCAACLYDSADGTVLAKRTEDIGRGHAERLFPVIDEVMGSRAYQELDRLAVCVGPGSFTGVRVGVAAMRGLSLALELPLIGISVFDSMARSAGEYRPLLVVIDARRDEVYARMFRADGAADPPRVLSPQEACDLALRSGAVLTGSGVPVLRPFLPAAPDGPSVLGETATADIASLAAIAAAREPGPDRPVPLYLRPPDARPQTGFALPRREAAS